MTASRSIQIDKETIVGRLKEAKKLIPYYEKCGYKDYGSADEVALKSIEKDYDLFITAIKLNGNDITLHAREGRLSHSDSLQWLGPDNYTMILQGFRNGTTVSRFTETVCDVLEKRAKNPELSPYMMGNLGAYTNRTKREVQPHASR